MQAELVLQLDEQLLQHARHYARRQGKTVSQVVTDYLTKLSVDEPASTMQELPPITKSLRGVLREMQGDEEDYKQYLAEKHL